MFPYKPLHTINYTLSEATSKMITEFSLKGKIPTREFLRFFGEREDAGICKRRQMMVCLPLEVCFVLKHVSNLSVLAMVLTVEHCPSLNQELWSFPVSCITCTYGIMPGSFSPHEAVLKMPLLIPRHEVCNYIHNHV